MSDIASLAARLAESPGLAGKTDVAAAVAALGIGGDSPVPVGDDAAAIPDGDGFLLLACEGMISSFVAAMPWFAGWSAVMVNLSDIAAMGGRPVALVNALWAREAGGADDVLEGMRAASAAFGVPVVGGHTNLRAEGAQLSVAVMGRARALLTSFDAAPGDLLVAAIDRRGAYHEPFPFFDAATGAPPDRLRADMDLLPAIAEAGLSAAAKDVSQGGIIGTAAMFAECSRVGLEIDLEALDPPEDVAVERWLTTFPSFGYLLAVRPKNADAACALFHERDIWARPVGRFDETRTLRIRDRSGAVVVRDLAGAPLIGCAPAEAVKEAADA